MAQSKAHIPEYSTNVGELCVSAMVFPASRFIVSALILLCLTSSTGAEESSPRSFAVTNDSFVRDGRPFQILSCSFHYSRAVAAQWDDRLLRLKAMGCNTIQTVSSRRVVVVLARASPCSTPADVPCTLYTAPLPGCCCVCPPVCPVELARSRARGV